jgi:hypothetical protein
MDRQAEKGRQLGKSTSRGEVAQASAAGTLLGFAILIKSVNLDGRDTKTPQVRVPER